MADEQPKLGTRKKIMLRAGKDIIGWKGEDREHDAGSIAVPGFKEAINIRYHAGLAVARGGQELVNGDDPASGCVDMIFDTGDPGGGEGLEDLQIIAAGMVTLPLSPAITRLGIWRWIGGAYTYYFCQEIAENPSRCSIHFVSINELYVVVRRQEGADWKVDLHHILLEPTSVSPESPIAPRAPVNTDAVLMTYDFEEEPNFVTLTALDDGLFICISGDTATDVHRFDMTAATSAVEYEASFGGVTNIVKDTFETLVTLCLRHVPPDNDPNPFLKRDALGAWTEELGSTKTYQNHQTWWPEMRTGNEYVWASLGQDGEMIFSNLTAIVGFQASGNTQWGSALNEPLGVIPSGVTMGGLLYGIGLEGIDSEDDQPLAAGDETNGPGWIGGGERSLVWVKDARIIQSSSDPAFLPYTSLGPHTAGTGVDIYGRAFAS